MVVDTQTHVSHGGDWLGQVVTSRAGRDRGHRYVVIGVLGTEMVLVSDGDRRAMGRPKKKNVKHLVRQESAAEVAAALTEGRQVRDDQIRAALAQTPPDGDEPSGGAG